jgi:predicted dehydrogenase
VGFAVIGLGRLGLDKIIPAFATCKLAKLTALTTGALPKGKRVAEQHGLPAEVVFGYADWKGLAATSSRTNGMHSSRSNKPWACP